MSSEKNSPKLVQVLWATTPNAALEWRGQVTPNLGGAERIVQGSFQGNEASSPVVGTKGQLETVTEIRLEMFCSEQSLPAVANVIKRVHPYETPAWEVYRLEPVPVEGTGQGSSHTKHA